MVSALCVAAVGGAGEALPATVRAEVRKEVLAPGAGGIAGGTLRKNEREYG